MEFHKGPFLKRNGAQSNQCYSVFEREERKENPNNPYNLDESVGQLLNRTFANSMESSFYTWDHDESNLLDNLDQIKNDQRQRQNESNANQQKFEQNFIDTMMRQQQKKSIPNIKSSSSGQQQINTDEQQQQQQQQNQKKDNIFIGNQGKQQQQQQQNNNQKRSTQNNNNNNNNNINQFSSSGFLPTQHNGQGDKLCETVISEYVSEDYHSQYGSPLKEGGNGLALTLNNGMQSNNNNNMNYNQLSVLISELESHVQSTLQDNQNMSILSSVKEQQLEKPIYLNVIVVGGQGLGKSTFIDAFLNKKFKKENDVIKPKTQEIVEIKGTRKENKINLHLNMIDTPGYTEQTNIDQWINHIIDFVSSKFEQYRVHEDEQFQDRKSVQQEDEKDCRIHVCLYFMQGPRISKSDLQAMLRLQEYLNIIPILAKGDCYTPDEVIKIKENIIKDSHDQKIQLFDCEAPLDKERLDKLRNGPFGPAPPFVMISSVQKIEVEKQKFQYARKYPWGICRIEDPEHSDFLLLYQLLIGFYIKDLKKLTDFYYRKYQKETKKKAKQQKLEQKEKKKKQILATGSVLAIGISILSYLKLK